MSTLDQVSDKMYKLSKTGAVLSWHIERLGDKYRTVSGQEGGQMITSEWTVATPKNVGRANETTGEQQPVGELSSRIQAKYDEGYRVGQPIKDAWQSPMLAHEFDKVTTKKPLKFPVFSQPKLDGMRCIVNKDGMWSRNGKPIVSAPHIRKALEPFFNNYPEIELDGELYSHKFKDDFNQIISLAKKSKPTAKDLSESAAKLEYWVYDNRGTVSPFNQRLEWLKATIAGQYRPTIRLLWTNIADSQEDLDALMDSYLDEGFEGQMVRLDKPYENCRTNSLLKRKVFITEDLPILDVIEGIGNRSGIAGAVAAEFNGKRFQASITGSFEFCRELLENKSKYIGQIATFKWQNLTPDGIPRFPNMLIIRNYE